MPEQPRIVHLPHKPPRPRWRQLLTLAKWALALLAVAIISGSLFLLGIFIFNPNGAEEFTVGRRPPQYYQLFDNEERAYLDETYARVQGVAHNSGGSIETTVEALIFGADVIEVDVVSIDGQLHAAHTPPLPFIGPRFFRGPSLERVWTASYRAEAMKLDLKEDSPAFVALVSDFLTSRQPGRDVIVASRSTFVLYTLSVQAPEAILLLSVPDEDAFDALMEDTSLQGVIDGVTIRESVLNYDRALRLQEAELLIYAWTVNDIARVNELVGMRVNGITTDNLALLTLLGDGGGVAGATQAGNRPRRRRGN